MASYATRTLSLLLLASLSQHAAAAARVVQLVAGRHHSPECVPPQSLDATGGLETYMNESAWHIFERTQQLSRNSSWAGTAAAYCSANSANRVCATALDVYMSLQRTRHRLYQQTQTILSSSCRCLMMVRMVTAMSLV
jgi:hypothetical protein